jgi:hypothetical protein
VQLVRFAGQFNDGQVRADVPVLPPQVGPDLTLDFERD